VEARPQREVRIQRLLRLEPDEVGHRVEWRAPRAFEQQLSRQGGASATASVEEVGGDAGQYGGIFSANGW